MSNSTVKFADSLRATTTADRPHIEAFRRSLMESVPHLSARDHEAILSHFVESGLATKGGVVQAAAGNSRRTFPVSTFAQARAASPEPRYFDGLRRRLERAGFSLGDENEIIDTVALTKALRASGLPVEQRMELRSELFACGLIEP
jgi:hypothetical protein